MIDLHCHILPGIDDGSQTIDDALDFARAAVAAGMTTMIATPHVSPAYPNDSSTIAAGVAALSARLTADQISLEVLPGAEIAITQIAQLRAGELARLSLGGGPWLLLESPFTMIADMIPTIVGWIRAQGHQVVLAHPERCPDFHRRTDLLEVLVREQGVLLSVTAGSLVGDFGGTVQRFALSLAAKGLVHNVASDAHDCDRRPPGVADALERAGLGDYIELLAQTVPAAIIAGDPLPPMPTALLARRPTGRLHRRLAARMK